MKRLAIMIGALFLLVVCIISCESSGMTEENDSSEGLLIPSQDMNEDIFSFFEKELPETSGAPYYDSGIPFVFSGNEKDQCFIINNKRDFEKVYTGKTSLPNIDFAQFTLVIVRNYVAAGIFRDKLSIKMMGKKSIFLNVFCKRGMGCYTANFIYLYSWSIFPKFEASKVVIKKYLDGQESDWAQ